MGMAIGLAFGLTPLLSLHNLVILAVAMLTTVSFPGVIVGWVIAVPIGFMLDRLFDRVGMALLTTDALTPLWVWIVNTPVVALTQLNNTIVLGSLVVWLIALVPSFLLFRVLVARYRVHIFAHIQKWRIVQVVKTSKIYGLYDTFRP